MGNDPDADRLLAERQAARERRDFTRADALRDQLRRAGWLVRDTPDGPELVPAPPYETVDPAALTPCWELPDGHDVSVVVHVAGWPEDVAGEATGRALEDLAREDQHLRVLHLDPAAGFGAAMNLGMGQALGRVLVWLDPHV